MPLLVEANHPHALAVSRAILIVLYGLTHLRHLGALVVHNAPQVIVLRLQSQSLLHGAQLFVHLARCYLSCLFSGYHARGSRIVGIQYHKHPAVRYAHGLW